ncbi:MAG TPA: hypothetical protein VFX04_09935 [Rhodanobacteraceae bacterium]|jgi:hypothetical protein|nr:hypothetical protein [Rhodanobacteraceae bacterium]
MRLRKYTVLFALFVLCLAFDAWVYGSLAREPEVGPALTSSARAHAPLLHAYIVLGTPIAAHFGASGIYVASAAFGDAYPAMAADPATADSLLFRGSRGPLRGILIVLFWAAPLLLALALAAWVLRSRETHLMGSARH